MVNLKVLDAKCKKIRSAVKEFLEYNNDNGDLTDVQIELIIDKTMIDLGNNLFMTGIQSIKKDEHLYTAPDTFLSNFFD